MHGTIVDNWAAFVSSPTGLWECVCVLVEDLSDLNVCLVSLFIQLLQLLLSILLLLMSFWYPWFFFFFFVPFLRPSPYLLRQPPTIASAFPQKHRGSILFATKDPFQELFSDISLSVKHSSNPFSEFKSANKSHNPHLLPFCKSPPPILEWVEHCVILLRASHFGELCTIFLYASWWTCIKGRWSGGHLAEHMPLSPSHPHSAINLLSYNTLPPPHPHLFTQLTHCCLMFSRHQTDPAG